MHNLTDDDWKAKKLSVATWEANVDILPEQKVIKEVLARNANASFGPNCYIAPDCNFFTDSAVLARNVRIASQVTLRGNITMGNDVSVNPLTNIIGNVKIGDAVRIASSVQIFGFNHGFERVDKLIKDQPITSKGIEIGAGTWVGAGVSIVDGVKIGAHCVVAAGAVVTKSFPDFSIIGGVPASLLKRRIQDDGRNVTVKNIHSKNNSIDYCVDLPRTGVLSSEQAELNGWIAVSSYIDRIVIEQGKISRQITNFNERPDVLNHLQRVRPRLAKSAKIYGFSTGLLSDSQDVVIEMNSKFYPLCTITLRPFPE